jgi:hypothetical protein
MKNYVFILFLSLTVTAVFPNLAQANNGEKIVLIDHTRITGVSEKDAFVKRLNEIRDMDRSTLNAQEKSNLKNELKAMKHQLRPGGGLYLSIGSLIVIIILLIILL